MNKIIGLIGLYLMAMWLPIPQKVDEPELRKGKAEWVDDCYYLPYTEDEINLMARVVMSEGSILSMDAKEMIAQTIINRVNSDDFPNTIEEVIFQPNQFSVSDNGEPTAECYEAVDNAIINMQYPYDMLYFRNSFVQYGWQYYHENNLYFSTTHKH